MTDSNEKPSARAKSLRQARENAEAARDTRKSHQTGIDDDSEIMQSLVAALGAPVEGALDSVRERDRLRERGDDPGAHLVGGVAGQREQDAQNPDERETRHARVPTRPQDAEAEPGDIAEDHTPGKPRGG